jgi:kynureninase
VIPALYAAAEGPKILRRAGVGAIREKSVRLTSHLIGLADARGYTVNAPRDPARRGGTVAIDVPHGYEVTQHLLSRNILVDYRVGAGIRIAPHFFTREDELDEAISEIDKALESGSWQRFSEKIAVVT